MEADIADELVALDVGRDLCFGFNHPAAAVWKLLASARSSDELVDELIGQFDVERPDCEADVAHLLGELTRLGLVERI